MIHSRSFRVTGYVNAVLASPRSIPTVHMSRMGGVVLPFRRCISAGGMTQANQPPSGSDHAALIETIASRRDRAAFSVLFAYFGPRVKAWMLRAGLNPTAAEELAQETMLMVWQKAHLFDPSRAGASAWIFTIARNLRIDAQRRERHPSDLMPDPSDDLDPPPLADRMLAMAQQESRIRTALGLLPPEQADVIRKAFFEEKVHAEIEKELGIPLGTVKSRLRLAIGRLRAVLGDLR